MTTVVGLTYPPWHDNGVAVVVDGKLVFAVEEERFTRHKHASAELPFRSLIEAFAHLKKMGIRPTDIDAFALNFHPSLYPFWERSHIVRKNGYEAIGRYNGIRKVANSLLWSALHGLDYTPLLKLVLREAFSKVGESLPDRTRIVPVRHHLAHAASAYYFSGFPSSSVMTIDAYGEVESTVIWKVTNGEFEPITSINLGDGSLGYFYEFVSEALGFNALEGPGKVMGLAPYGEFDERIWSRFQKIAVFGEPQRPYVFSRQFGFGSSRRGVLREYRELTDFLTSGLDLHWNTRGEVSPTAAKVAWALQHFLEKAVLSAAEWAKTQTGSDKMGLAGGVALNAKANMELHYSRLFNDLFVFPAANDSGSPIGAAAYVYEHVCGGKMRHGRITSLSLGPEYDEDYVKRVTQKTKLHAEFVGDSVGVVAEMAAKGKVVGWFQGRCELGPRALGSRSIVADPRRKENWLVMNEIKGREHWRPLAPSLLSSDKGTYFDGAVDHEFMVMMFRMREDARKRVPAVCHVDLTARPQMVDKANGADARWYEMIKSFKGITGEGLIINTSFNLAGEPLVQTPEEALRDFALSGLDALYLQGFLLEKR